MVTVTFPPEPIVAVWRFELSPFMLYVTIPLLVPVNLIDDVVPEQIGFVPFTTIIALGVALTIKIPVALILPQPPVNGIV